MDPVVIGYSPNDFFWESAKDAKDNKGANITDDWCEQNKGSTCTAWTDNKNCYQKELCKNKEYADVFTKAKTSHSGSDGRLFDTQTDYKDKIQTATNLGIGIIASLVFIYYNK